MDGLHFSLSDRLRNCRGAATTPSQSVTATAFPCHRTARGLRWCFLPTPQPAQLLHSFPFLQFVLDRPKLLIYILHVHVPVQGYVTEIKTPPIWLQAQADLRLYIKSTDIIYLGCDCMKTH